MPFGNEVIHRTIADVGTGLQLIAAGSMTFGGNGKILSWDIYAGRVGTVSLQVWRPEPGGQNTYTVVCENAVRALAPGLNSFPVTESEQCTFLAGDVVGWSHTGAGVIEYTDAPGNNAADQVLWRCAPRSFKRHRRLPLTLPRGVQGGCGSGRRRGVLLRAGDGVLQAVFHRRHCAVLLSRLPMTHVTFDFRHSTNDTDNVVGSTKRFSPPSFSERPRRLRTSCRAL